MLNPQPFQGLLLVSDMDGTLITPQFQIPKRNLDAIERFKQKGGLFSLATGRSESSAGRYTDRIKPNAPAVVYNGSAIYDYQKKEYIYNAYLPVSCKEMLRAVLNKFPHIGAEVFSGGMIYIINENYWTHRHVDDENLEYVVTDIDNAPQNWYKILFAGENISLRELQEYTQSVLHDGYYFIFSNTMYFEVLPTGVSKGSTLLKLADLLGINHQNTIAIGDYYNDIELISSAGFGCTVECAPDEIKKRAKLVLGRCENGAVADLIEYLEEKYESRSAVGE